MAAEDSVRNVECGDLGSCVRQTLSGMVLLGSVLRCSEGTEEVLPFPRVLYGLPAGDLSKAA